MKNLSKDVVLLSFNTQIFNSLCEREDFVFNWTGTPNQVLLKERVQQSKLYEEASPGLFYKKNCLLRYFSSTIFFHITMSYIQSIPYTEQSLLVFRFLIPRQ